MNPTHVITAFIFLFISFSAFTQDRTCYDRLRELGIQDYSNEKYEDAIKKWTAAKSCSYVPGNNDLDRKIKQAESKLNAPSSSTRQPYEPEMVFVEGFYFNMGSNDGDDDEKPIHGVTIPNFYIGKYEVTNEQFCVFLNEMGNRIEGGVTWLEIDSDYCLIERRNGTFKPKSGYAEHPVIEVSWYGAVAYAKWLSNKTGKSYRLPSEAEWEYAARGGKKTNDYTYAGSNKLDEVAWHDGNSGGKTYSVGQKKANELGIHDMSGNVWEWVQDCWNDSYTGAPTDGSAWTSGNCDLRVLRGGSWNDYNNNCRVANRGRYIPGYRSSINGFRLAQDR